MARAGDSVSDPISGADVVFRQTSAETAGTLLQLDVRAEPRWSAGPVHIHPRQEERIEIREGSLASKVDGRERIHRPGDILRIPAGTPHTIWNGGDNDLRLVVEFRPALRTAELFEAAFGLGRDRATRTPLRDLARAAFASRGFRDEVRLVRPTWLSDGLVAGAIAALPSGIPTTAHALVSDRSLAESSLAAGSVLPRERRTHRLLAAVAVHFALSVGRGVVLAALLPRKRTVVIGAATGAAIGALDVVFIGRRLPRMRTLRLVAQLADHAAYGGAVAAVVAYRRSRRASAAGV